MSSRDKLIEMLMRDQLGPLNATRRMQEHLIEQQQKAFTNMNKAALESAARAAADMRHSYSDYIENAYSHLRAVQIQLLSELKVPSIAARLAEIANQTFLPLSLAYRSQAIKLAVEVAKSFRTSQIDVATLALTTFRNSDIPKIRGNSIDAAFAALMAEQVKGFESLRESFAGIVADALKKGFEDLEERDEQAFARLEQLIDEKVATLPQNAVTAESLWKFLITLFLSLTAMGINLYQVIDAKRSSKTQAKAQDEQQIKQDTVIAVLERIAINTGRLIPERDQNVYYVVEREINLKLKPKNSSSTIATLFPNHKTRLVQMKHKWIYVEYFDYLEGIPRYGWVNKKYLKRVND